MPTPPNRSSSSPLPANSRSLFSLSRFAPSFSSKTRNFSEPEIQLDDPHRQYSPGDSVKGTVVLKVFKSIRVTHLVISLHGYVHVYKNPNTPGEGYRTHNPGIATGKGRTKAGYYGNGFATLFEDEMVLCGDGGLQKGVYHFKFALDFPSKGIPSSIDFERGTISYMITATLTRPTTISPTTTRDQRVFLIENIDIGPISEPKPRKISLEPKTAKAKPRQPKKRPTDLSTTTGNGDSVGTSRDSRNSDLSSTREEIEPQSPSPSEMSFETLPSTTTGSGEDSGNASGSAQNGSGDLRNVGRSSSTKKPITATITLLKAGFLRGDTIQLKINVTHTKYVKSLHGIIVTLYRQARVDMHPALPVIRAKDGKTETEEYFPRSKTGLGGLSLSNSGSTHVFRKDLSQSFAPLIIDPRTFTAEVKASVRVPDEAFPSITNVPGAMITFKYYVEVVVDLQAKLTSLGRFFPSSGMMSVPEGFDSNPGIRTDASGAGIFSSWGGNILDTSGLRRDKSVVACVFGVIVGTQDSERRKNKGKAVAVNRPQTNANQDYVHEIQPNGQQESYDYHYDEAEYYDSNYPANQQIDHHDHYYEQYPFHAEPAHYDDYIHTPRHEQPPSFPIPRVAFEDESQLSEKERIRRAEERLLPSAPPAEGDTQPGSSSTAAAAAHAPSAPVLSDDENLLFIPMRTRAHANSNASNRPPPSPSFAPSDYQVGPSAPPPSLYAPSAPPPIHASFSPSAPAPAYSSSATHDQASSSLILASGPLPIDDKQELHRRQLEAERSAPPSDDGHTGPSASTSGPSQPPSDSPEQYPDTVPTAPDIADLQLGEAQDEVMATAAVPQEVVTVHEDDERRRGEGLPAYEPRKVYVV